MKAQISIDAHWALSGAPHKWCFDNVTPYFRQSILDALQGHIRYDVPVLDIRKISLKRSPLQERRAEAEVAGRN